MTERYSKQTVCEWIRAEVDKKNRPMSSEELYDILRKKPAAKRQYTPQAFRARFMTILRRFGQFPAEAARDLQRSVVVKGGGTGPIRQADIMVNPAKSVTTPTQTVLQLVPEEVPQENGKMLQVIPQTQIGVRSLDYEGQPLTYITYKDRPAVIAKEIGEKLGYANGNRLANKITSKWGDEFILDQHYVILTGLELAEIKQVFEHTSRGDVSLDPMLLNTARLMLLFEAGVNLVLTKTQKPAGVRLRNYLAGEVMPQLNRTGAYDPALTVNEQGVLTTSDTGLATLDFEDQLRSRELGVRETLAKAQLRRAEALILNAELRQEQWNHKIKHEQAEVQAANAEYEAKSSKKASVYLEPTKLAIKAEAAGVQPQWGGKSITRVGQENGLSGNMVGRIINDLTKRHGIDYRTDPEYCVQIAHIIKHEGAPTTKKRPGTRILPRFEAIIVAHITSERAEGRLPIKEAKPKKGKKAE